MSHSLARHQIELMLPVGSWESLAAAAQTGADSIYFGVQGLNMRSVSSANFSLDDLAQITSFCRQKNIKTYLTLNTVLYDEDLDYLYQILDRAKIEGVTAVIVADQAALMAAYDRGIEIHLSTQLNVSNIETVAFYSRFADVVVLARELTLNRVRQIYDQIARRNIRGPRGELVRIEMFAHGALCMAVSGKCYLSLHEAWKSANRGECRQICRRRYQVRDVETGGELLVDNQYIMSPKDLCTIDFLPAVIDAGVRVLKIEGRARGAHYVRTVGQSYLQAIEAVAQGQMTDQLGSVLKEELRRVFNRDFWAGYYLGQPLGEWSDSYGSSATERKVYVGKVTNYFAKIGVVEIKVEAERLSVGDKLLLTGVTTGAIEMMCDHLRVDEVSASTADKGVYCSIATTSAVRRGDKLYKLVPSK